MDPLTGGDDMKTLSCGDLGGMNCSFEARGKTAEEVKKAMYAHAEKAHKDILKKMTAADNQRMQVRMDDILSRQR